MTSSERRTRDSYDRFAGVWAETTDQNLWNEALERRLVRMLLPSELAGSRVLDAGCAAGAHAVWLAEHGCEVTAIDASPAMIEAARARDGHGSVRYEVADFSEPLAFPGRSFDGILSSLALHHVRDIAVPIGEFARLLRPDGWLVVSLDHPAGLFGGKPRPDYFATEMMTDTWSKGELSGDVSFWRRPLSAAVDAFADNGFLIERTAEAQVDDEARREYPAEAAQVEGTPTFIAYKAIPDPRRVSGRETTGPSRAATG